MRAHQLPQNKVRGGTTSHRRRPHQFQDLREMIHPEGNHKFCYPTELSTNGESTCIDLVLILENVRKRYLLPRFPKPREKRSRY